MGKSAGSPPPAPDYVGAAKEQGAANVEATRIGAKLNNPNVVSPYGTQSVTYGGGFDQQAYNQALANYQNAWNAWNTNKDQYNKTFRLFASHTPYRAPEPTKPNPDNYYSGDINQPTITQKLSPEQQAIYNQQVQNQLGLGVLGTQGITSAKGVIGVPVDFSGAPAMPSSSQALRDEAYNAQMQRVNQDTQVAKDNANSQLIAAGIRPGTTAYDNSMRLIDRAYNDARQQAILNTGNVAQQNLSQAQTLRQQALSEYIAQRQTPLNEISALMSGSQVSNPFTMPGYGGAQTPQAAPIFAAQNALANYNTDIYNANAANAANQNAGATQAGIGILMAAAMVY